MDAHFIHALKGWLTFRFPGTAEEVTVKADYATVDLSGEPAA
jgi:hypothetical protein